MLFVEGSRWLWVGISRESRIPNGRNRVSFSQSQDPVQTTEGIKSSAGQLRRKPLASASQYPAGRLDDTGPCLDRTLVDAIGGTLTYGEVQKETSTLVGMLGNLQVSAQPFGFVVPTTRYTTYVTPVYRGTQRGRVRLSRSYLGTHRPQLCRGRNLRLPSALKSVSSGTALYLG